MHNGPSFSFISVMDRPNLLLLDPSCQSQKWLKSKHKVEMGSIEILQGIKVCEDNWGLYQSYEIEIFSIRHGAILKRVLIWIWRRVRRSQNEWWCLNLNNIINSQSNVAGRLNKVA